MAPAGRASPFRRARRPDRSSPSQHLVEVNKGENIESDTPHFLVRVLDSHVKGPSTEKRFLYEARRTGLLCPLGDTSDTLTRSV